MEKFHRVPKNRKNFSPAGVSLQTGSASGTSYHYVNRPEQLPFKLKDVCSGWHFVGCHNKLTNDQIPEENRIPNAPSTDDVLNNGPGSNSDPDTDYQKYFNDTWDAAIKQASEICKKEQCNCKSINVHSQMVGSGWDPDNWGEPNLTKQQTVSCEGAK